MTRGRPERGDSHGQLHGARGDPAFGAGALRTKPLLVVVAPNKIEVVVHEVGIDLHRQGKEHAEQKGQPADVACRLGNGQGATDEHGHGCACEGLGSCSQDPGPKGGLANGIVVHDSCQMGLILEIISYKCFG